MRVRDLNWMQLEEYLQSDDRILLPVGSTEQHAYLSLETDNILAERASVEAAEPLGVPVLPVLPYGVTGFTAYPGSPTLLESTPSPHGLVTRGTFELSRADAEDGPDGGLLRRSRGRRVKRFVTRGRLLVVKRSSEA